MSERARALELSTRLRDALLALASGADGAVGDVTAELGRTHPRLLVEVLSVKQVPTGSGVSYGHTYVTAAPTTLALAAMGYGDGLPRKAGNRAEVTVTVHGTAHRVPIVGRVAMNAFVADVGDLEVSAGDSMVVFGDPARGELALAEWARDVGESAVALLAGLASRVTVRAEP